MMCGERRQRRGSMKYPAELLFRNFSLVRQLGEGQYGRVWLCEDRRTGKQYACKEMDKAAHPRSIVRETECLARVQSHVNVVRVHQAFEDESSVFLLMELCDGGDLLARICSGGGMPEAESRAVLRQLAQAVQHCHDRGVVHRDIKPENILLCGGGSASGGNPTVKLADFGLATALKKGKKTQGWVGSPPYEAPEVMNLETYDHSADVWSMGVVLYGMLSASWPSFAKGRVFNEREDFLAPVWDEISPKAKDLITKMLRTEPHLRPTLPEILSHPWLALAPAPLSAHSIIEAWSPLPLSRTSSTSVESPPPLVGQEESMDACPSGPTASSVPCSPQRPEPPLPRSATVENRGARGEGEEREGKEAGPGERLARQSKSIGKAFLQFVTDTLSTVPLCNKLIPPQTEGGFHFADTAAAS